METLKDRSRYKTPSLNASFLSKWFFWYVNPLFQIGNKDGIRSSDIYKIHSEDKCKNLTALLRSHWEKEKESNVENVSLMRCLLKMTATRLLVITICSFLIECTKLSQTVLLKLLLEELSQRTYKENNNIFVYAGGLGTTLFMAWLALHPILYYSEVTGCKLKSATTGLLYQKLLKIRMKDVEEISRGHIITLFTSDSHKILEGLKKFCFIILAPLEVIIATAILWMYLGMSCLPGVLILVAYVPFQYFMGNYFAKIRWQVVEKTDKRIKQVAELLSNIKVIKMNAWEEIFKKQIEETRKQETKENTKAATAEATNVSLYGSSPYIIMLCTVITFYYSDIEDFLKQAEIRENVCVKEKEGSSFVSFYQVSVYWSKESIKPTIEDVTFTANEKNKFTMIIGSVATGKTTLLMTLLGELPLSHGSLRVNGTVAYVSQKPWIFPGTIRQNILFGMNYNKKYFDIVAKACALEQDFTELPYGDLTRVGGEGETLSGGQQSRISLARAIYRNADIYLLDDPLSAVDASVGKQIFERCIKELLKNKIVLLNCHEKIDCELGTQVMNLQKPWQNENSPSISDHDDSLQRKRRSLSIFFNDSIQGQLPKTPITFRKKTNKNKAKEIFKSVYNEEKRIKTIASIYHLINKMRSGKPSNRNVSPPITYRRSTLGPFKESGYFYPVIIQEENELITNISHGAVSWKLYFKYFLDGAGLFQSAFVITLLAFVQALMLFTDYWIGEWSIGESQRRSNESVSVKFYNEDDPDINMYMFITLVIVGSALNLLRAILFYITILKCNKLIHNRMLHSILKARFQFFTSNSADVVMMDDDLTWKFYNFLQLGFLNIATIFINCVSVPYLWIVVLPLALASIFMRNYYIKTAATVKKIEASFQSHGCRTPQYFSIDEATTFNCSFFPFVVYLGILQVLMIFKAQSPLLTHLTSTMSGITTIRSFDKQKFVLKEFYDCVDYATEAEITFLLCTRWFSQRVDFLALIFSTCAIFAPILADNISENIDEGLIGVSLTYVLALGSIFQWFLRQSSEVENLMTSVERVYEYTKIPSEETITDHLQFENKNTREENANVTGYIFTEKTSYTYDKSLPPVLKNISFNIKRSEKVGIVGRTGSGKSSIFAMLLRLGDTSGEVLINGENINFLPLHALRKGICIISQQPFIINGTLRKNLDPFQQYSDEEIWNALEKVSLKESLQTNPEGLQQKLKESGSNMSVGERQLLCLARALLRKNEILLMDEATANVDNKTDELVQQVIKTSFAKCTVLTIAHRLNTIIDYDKVMVIENGEVVEFDGPEELLQNEQGYFSRLVNEVGSK